MQELETRNPDTKLSSVSVKYRTHSLDCHEASLLGLGFCASQESSPSDPCYTCRSRSRGASSTDWQCGAVILAAMSRRGPQSMGQMGILRLHADAGLKLGCVIPGRPLMHFVV